MGAEEGREFMGHMLGKRCKDVTAPRTTPSKNIPPVSMPFREGVEECIVNIPPRTRPEEDWVKIEAQIDKWLKSGKVEKSTSPFNAPHVVAKKATPPHCRLAQDFRRLNDLTKPMKFPLRKIDELMEETSQKRHKSSLDQDQAHACCDMRRRDTNREQVQSPVQEVMGSH